MGSFVFFVVVKMKVMWVGGFLRIFRKVLKVLVDSMCVLLRMNILCCVCMGISMVCLCSLWILLILVYEVVLILMMFSVLLELMLV